MTVLVGNDRLYNRVTNKRNNLVCKLVSDVWNKFHEFVSSQNSTLAVFGIQMMGAMR